LRQPSQTWPGEGGEISGGKPFPEPLSKLSSSEEKLEEPLSIPPEASLRDP